MFPLGTQGRIRTLTLAHRTNIAWVWPNYLLLSPFPHLQGLWTRLHVVHGPLHLFIQVSVQMWPLLGGLPWPTNLKGMSHRLVICCFNLFNYHSHCLSEVMLFVNFCFACRKQHEGRDPVYFVCLSITEQQVKSGSQWIPNTYLLNRKIKKGGREKNGQKANG